MKKRGQVTLFILIAIIIVSIVLVFFLWAKPTYFSEKTGGPKFEGCVKDALEQVIEDLGENGGFINPDFTYQYNGENYVYLCYTEEYYETCTVQVPFLKNNFEEQAEKIMREKIDVCYSNSLDDLKAQGYEVSTGDLEYEILFEPGVARAEIKAPTTVGSQRFTKFNVKLNSNIYDILMISTSLLQFESKYGDTDTSSLMILYPDYTIDKIKRSDGTTVYTLEDKTFGTKFKFASKSLVWPSGYNL